MGDRAKRLRLDQAPVDELGALVLRGVTGSVARATVDDNFMPARGQTDGKLLGAGLESAVVRRYAARADECDLHGVGSVARHERRTYSSSFAHAPRARRRLAARWRLRSNDR